MTTGIADKLAAEIAVLADQIDAEVRGSPVSVADRQEGEAFRAFFRWLSRELMSLEGDDPIVLASPAAPAGREQFSFRSFEAVTAMDMERVFTILVRTRGPAPTAAQVSDRAMLGLSATVDALIALEAAGRAKRVPNQWRDGASVWFARSVCVPHLGRIS